MTHTQKIKKKHSLIWKISMSVLGIIATYLVFSVAWEMYAVLVPHYKDRDLFSYIGLPYDKKAIVYSYANGSDYGLAFAKITPTQARKILAGPSTVFSVCHEKVSYGDEFRCTETWVPNTTKNPTLRILGMQTDVQKRAAEIAHGLTVTKDTLCTFSPNITLSGSLVVEETLCVNPANGYVMYEYIVTS